MVRSRNLASVVAAAFLLVAACNGPSSQRSSPAAESGAARTTSNSSSGNASTNAPTINPAAQPRPAEAKPSEPTIRLVLDYPELIESVAFSSDGKYVSVCGRAKTVYVCDLS